MLMQVRTQHASFPFTALEGIDPENPPLMRADSLQESLRWAVREKRLRIVREMEETELSYMRHMMTAQLVFIEPGLRKGLCNEEEAERLSALPLSEEKIGRLRNDLESLFVQVDLA